MVETEITAEQLAANPLLAALVTLLSLLAFLILVGSIATWSLMAMRLKRGEPILAVRPWQPRAWGLLDLIFVFMTMVASQVVSLQLSRSLFGMKITPGFSEDDMPLSAIVLMGVGNLMLVLIVASWIMFRHRATLDHLGFRKQNVFSDIKLGVLAAVASLPVVYLLMFVVSQSTNTEYDHPLITKMLDGATLASFLAGSFSAVIAAPLAEEFLFRVLLQGWLQSISRSWFRHAWFWGASESQRNEPAPLSNLESRLSAEPKYDANVFGGPTATVESDRPGVYSFSGNAPVPEFDEPILASIVEVPLAEPSNDRALPPPLWPVFVSGTLFGLAHLGYGLSYVPLIALGFVLGLLYRATHSIWPSLVVHFVLNLLSMLALALAIVAKQSV